MKLIAILVGIWALALLVAVTLGRQWWGWSLPEAITMGNLVAAAGNLGVGIWYSR